MTAGNNAMDMTFFPELKNSTGYKSTVSDLYELADIIRGAKARDKNGLPLFKSATFSNNLRSNDTCESITAIEIDYDAGLISANDGMRLLQDAGLHCLIYTTPSSDDLKQDRWRAILPTSKPISPDDHNELVATVNGVLGGIIADESFTLALPYFYGHTEGKKQPVIYVEDGDYIDTLPELKKTAIYKHGAGGDKFIKTEGRIAHDKKEFSLIKFPPAQITPEELKRELFSVPNNLQNAISWVDWNTIGMAVWNATEGSKEGYEIFAEWTDEYPNNDPKYVLNRWHHWGRSRGDFVDAISLRIMLQRHRTRLGLPDLPKVEAVGGGGQLQATEYKWIEPNLIPQRDFIYGQHYIRGYISATVAAGGLGKSANNISEVLSMCCGRDLLHGGEPLKQKYKVWLWNLEDGLDELQRRIQATAKFFMLTEQDLKGQLYVENGRTSELIIASSDRGQVVIHEPVIDALVEELIRLEIDVLVVDPFVHSHRVSENAAEDISRVMEKWREVAEKAQISVELIHHTRKLNNEAATAESSRGSTALLGAARSVRAINRCTEEVARKFAINEDERKKVIFFGVGDKANLAPMEDSPKWRQLVSVELGNGDNVGIVDGYSPPDPWDGVQTFHLQKIQRAIASPDEHRKFVSYQSKEWAGLLVAEVLDLDPEKDRRRILTLLKTWVKNGALVEGEIKNKNYKLKPAYEVGVWAE